MARSGVVVEVAKVRQVLDGQLGGKAAAAAARKNRCREGVKG